MKPWSAAQKEYVFKHLHKKTLSQIARDIARTERALNLFLHRNRHDPRISVKSNLLIQVLSLKFKDIACFTPTRSFFDAVQIGQKRYWSIFKGNEIVTEDEIKRIAHYLEVSLDDIYQVRQLELF